MRSNPLHRIQHALRLFDSKANGRIRTVILPRHGRGNGLKAKVGEVGHHRAPR